MLCRVSASHQVEHMQSKKGHKTFLAGAVVLVLFGLVHLAAVYHGNFLPPADDKKAEIKRLAMEDTVTMGPFKPSAWGGMQILNSSYSILLIYVGILNLWTMRPAAQIGRLRGLTGCNIFFVSLLLLITIIFQFPPPMLFAGIALILFGVSWMKQG